MVLIHVARLGLIGVRLPVNSPRKSRTHLQWAALNVRYFQIGPPSPPPLRQIARQRDRRRHPRSSSYKFRPPVVTSFPLAASSSSSSSSSSFPSIGSNLGLCPSAAAFSMAGVSRGAVNLALAVATMALALLLLPGTCSAELQRFQQPVKGDGSLSLLVVGDWGREGQFNQSAVATQMGKIGEMMDIDFVISTGDNFYEDGLSSADDKAFQESFTKIYTAKSLQKQWYLVLGNHDYRGNVSAQVNSTLGKIEPRWLCLRSFIVNAGFADFFFVDTTPFVKSYWTNPGGSHYDWRGVAPRDSYISNLLKEVSAALKGSTAEWKIVVGHHPVRSVSEHGDTAEVLDLLLPILKENGVDLFINGHDHCLEHISSRDSPIQYLTSGGGSKAWRGTFTPNADELRFFYDGQGFMSLRLTRSAADVVFYDVYGRAIYKWSADEKLNPAT